VPRQALDVGLLLVVLVRGQVHEVGEVEAGLLRVAVRLARVVGDQSLDRRGLVSGHPQDGAVAADGREVGVRRRGP
jgi:hypothetical protein